MSELLLQEAVEAGKVKYLGVSEMAPADVRKAHKIHPLSLVELEWSLLSRDSEVRLARTCCMLSRLTALDIRL